MTMKLSELNDLDFNNAGNWPTVVKALAVLLVVAAVGTAGYWFDSKSLLEELDAAQRSEQQLRQKFIRKQKVLANIDAYRAQLDELSGMLATMLQQLPTRTEMPDLLEDISNKGKTNGLIFELFKPQNEQPRDFYAAKPIAIRAKANYHQFSAFVSAIAAMSRIVTLESATLSSGKDDNLLIEATLQTYRYLEEEDAADPKRESKGTSKGKPKKKRRGTTS
jgi:type IV pilus assembly protein PilO